MNKYLFEDWLRNRLADLPPEELERVIADLLADIDDRMIIQDDRTIMQ